MNYKTIIIGTGGQGCFADIVGSGNEDKIISFAKALNLHNNFELIGLLDTDKERLFKASDLWDCPAYTDLKHMKIHDKNLVDIAIVSTSDNTHYEILKQLAEYPLKLVIVEKPICENLEQAREIVELYKAKGIPLMVNYTRRFLPYYDNLKEYGKPISSVCRFNRGWLHTASHAIDFFNMLGCDNYSIFESDSNSRVWIITVAWKYNIFTEHRFGEQPVWPYYNKSHMHIMNNAYEFLEGREEIKCTGEMALHSLEICFNLM